MKQRIDFAAKTDRELLILTAQSTNIICDRLDILNGTVIKHEIRLVKLENKAPSCPPVANIKHKVSNSIGKWGLILIIATLGGGGLYAFGNGIGWW